MKKIIFFKFYLKMNIKFIKFLNIKLLNYQKSNFNSINENYQDFKDLQIKEVKQNIIMELFSHFHYKNL